MRVNGVLMERYWQGKTRVLREKPVPVTPCPPQISFGLNWNQIPPRWKYRRRSSVQIS